MSSTRLHSHPSLPAPVFHSGTTSVQSKSHVLAGVQDAYWSDDEAEDRECPLCLEEMDVSDLNFKPCPCAYQICRFCWHHIKENLNGRCPACRREYSDDTVQFKPINQEDHKRLTQQKKQRERERKELETLGRRHLANVRVVQRNVVYIVGMGPRFAKEELIPTLRSNEYFGQYGKISKILVVKRTSNNSSGRTPAIGLYVTYHRKEDAARCIAAVDGSPSPGGGTEIMRASYGTTKYCMAFLRGATCTDHSCMNLHEWGDESDCFTKEDLTTLKHTMKDMENRPRTVMTTKKSDEAEGLPRSASWAKTANTLANNTNASTARTSKRGTTTRSSRAVTTAEARPAAKSQAERKQAAAKVPVQTSSRPQTPVLPPTARPSTPATSKPAKTKEVLPPPPPRPRPVESPALSPVAPESDGGSSPHEPVVDSPATRPQSAQSTQAPPPGIPPPPGLSAPPGLPPAPLGLPPAPPGLPPPRTFGAESPFLQPSYQMSSQAQALVDDLRARREALVTLSSTFSPFPEFDRTLQALGGGENGGFSFTLDPKLASENPDPQMAFPDLDAEAQVPYRGGFMDAFPALRPSVPSTNSFMAPPGLSYPHNPSRSIYDPLSTRPPGLERQASAGANYMGSFDPFGAKEEIGQRQYSPMEDDVTRKVSRFGFARGRQGSTSSPLPTPSPITNSDAASHTSYYNSPDISSNGQQWQRRQQQEFSHNQAGSSMNSPVIQQGHAQAHSPYPQQSNSFQPFDSSVSEAQLRDLIQSSRERANAPRVLPDQAAQWKYASANPQFNDPAIMSARMVVSPGVDSPVPERAYAMSGLLASQQTIQGQGVTPSFGPPPGLSFPSQYGQHPNAGNGNGTYANLGAAQGGGSAHVSTSVSLAPSPALSSSDFPALTTNTKVGDPEAQIAGQNPENDAAKAKVEKKAALKAAATERATERQRLAQEKAVIKAAEKEKLAQEKAAERDRLKIEKEKIETDKAEREKVDKEKLAQLKVEKFKVEKEKTEREKTIKEQTTVLAAERERVAQVKKAAKLSKQAAASLSVEQNPTEPPSTTSAEPVPMLSKMPKKYKPTAKPIKIPDQLPEGSLVTASSTNLDTSYLPEHRAFNTNDTGSSDSRSFSLDGGSPTEPTSVEELLAQIDIQCPHMDVSNHPIFDSTKINPAAKMPLEYGPLVHALSALSVGGGSFANSMPSGSIDNAVSSFQQLLETLTQTISDLLRLLPRTTWDDSSSFDGVLRDMLKGDDFLDDGNEDGNNKEDEVAALTLALERRARWMEVQLSKLEELHRDINMAAVRAVLSFNDNGWDSHGFMPRVGNTLNRFDALGLVNDGKEVRAMTAEELDERLVVAREAAVFAETEVREMVERLQSLRPEDEEEY